MWCQCALPLGHVGATWRIQLDLCFLRPTRVHNPNGKSIGSTTFCTAHGRVSSVVPGHVLSPNNCPFAWGYGPHVIHAFLDPYSNPLPKRHLDRFSRLCTVCQECRRSCRGMPFSLKIAPSHGGSVPHLIRGSLGPPNSASQRASRSA